jgi:hypothetical protein
MGKSVKSKLTCERCNELVLTKDTYCQNCGGLFSDDLHCTKHKSVPADGVCVICSKPFCINCGGDVNKVFLCNLHFDHDVFEGMARVFGSMDNVRVHFAHTCLKQAGYHPYIYSRKYNPVADKVAITAIRNFGNHPATEQKVLVPFSEVLKAEKELKKHKFKEI